ncbi:Putative membrane protein [Mycoplasma leachii 99/014/6]|uniref:hypothetical protein n=1 Tax=Mycoplasma leachii TaxID=2105 RepID=UPI0002177128|nr:Putative membrane protein [Mycoplasma leachii 99/014/6]
MLFLKSFFNFIGLGLAISSVILSILCLVPKFKNNKKLVLVTNVFGVAFGFIAGGVLLIIGANNISSSAVISTTNTTTQIISTEPMNKEIINPEIEEKNIHIKKSEQNLDSLKITKKQFKYKKTNFSWINFKFNRGSHRIFDKCFLYIWFKSVTHIHQTTWDI